MIIPVVTAVSFDGGIVLLFFVFVVRDVVEVVVVLVVLGYARHDTVGSGSCNDGGGGSSSSTSGVAFVVAVTVCVMLGSTMTTLDFSLYLVVAVPFSSWPSSSSMYSITSTISIVGGVCCCCYMYDVVPNKPPSSSTSKGQINFVTAGGERGICRECGLCTSPDHHSTEVMRLSKKKLRKSLPL